MLAVAHPANEVACAPRLHRHRVGDCLQAGRVDAFAPDIERGELRDWLAAA
jgi:hypothetical protein